MDIWSFLFKELVYRPQLNFIKLIFDITKDIGWALVIVAIAFNIVAFRWFTKSFLNMQKRLALMQDIKNIQHYFTEKTRLIDAKIIDLSKNEELNKPQINELTSKKGQAFLEQQKLMGELNKRFDIAGNYSVKTILLQIWISIGLFTIFNDLANNVKFENGRLPGLYSGFWNGNEIAEFGGNLKAFGVFKLGSALEPAGLLWVPVVNVLFTVAAMYYTFKYTQKPIVRELTDFEKKQKEITEARNKAAGKITVDHDQVAKQSQMINLFLVPALTLSFNYQLLSGINLYYLLLSLLYLIRTLGADWYYRNHQYQYMTDVVEAGPVFPYQEHIEELNVGNFDLKGTPSEVMNYRRD